MKSENVGANPTYRFSFYGEQMKYLLILLLLVSCTTKCPTKPVEPKPTEPVVVETPAPVEQHEPVALKFKWNKPEWTKALVDQINISKLSELPLKDKKEFGWKECTDMVLFWGNILVEMAKWESNWKPEAKYHEPMGMWSRGLFQVSFVDKKRYGCPFTDEASVHDPERNIRCAVIIATRLVKQNGRIAGRINRRWQGVARYWAVLRGTRSYTKKALKSIKSVNY